MAKTSLGPYGGRVMDSATFESEYALRSGRTVDSLHDWGRYPEPCDCGEPECEGWAMGHQWEDAIIEDIIRTRKGRQL